MAVLQFPQPSLPPCAADVMSTDVLSAHPDDDVLEVAAAMLEAGVRHVPVVEGGRLIGIVSDRDVRTLVGEPVAALIVEDIDDEPVSVEWVMTANPIVATASTSLEDVARRLIEEHIGAMPVVDEHGGLLGMVSWVDLLHHAFVRRLETTPS